MILSYSKMVGMPIVELHTQTRIGKVGDLVINPESLNVAAFVLSRNIFSSKFLVINAADIVQVVRDGIIARDEDSVTDLEDNVRLKAMTDVASYGVGHRVLTESGELVGLLFDYTIESDDMAIKKLYVRRLFGERIIPISKVVHIDGKVITIKDKYEKIPIENESLETVAG